MEAHTKAGNSTEIMWTVFKESVKEQHNEANRQLPKESR